MLFDINSCIFCFSSKINKCLITVELTVACGLSGYTYPTFLLKNFFFLKIFSDVLKNFCSCQALITTYRTTFYIFNWFFGRDLPVFWWFAAHANVTTAFVCPMPPAFCTSSSLLSPHISYLSLLSSCKYRQKCWKKKFNILKVKWYFDFHGQRTSKNWGCPLIALSCP